jgi:hypothetical protein
MGIPTDIKAKLVICPKCKKDIRHGGYDFPGTNERGDITGNLLAAFNKKATDHLFYRKKNKNIVDYIKSFFSNKEINVDQDLYLAVPDPVEGHHLITCEAVKYDDWYKLFYQYCYDINCPQNGVILPGDMLVACHFAAPLHMGGHGATMEWDGKDFFVGKNYVALVKGIIGDMIADSLAKECKPLTASQIKKFHEEMLEKSNLIFTKVKQFRWLITSDGMHYHEGSNIGCYDNCRTLKKKREAMSKETGVRKSDNTTAEFVMNITKAYTGSGCPQKRDHKRHGCDRDKPVNWGECRYDKKDKNIENLND